MPNAFTNVAAASPPVRATTATAIGIVTATAAVDDGRLCTSACRSSHSLTNPLSGGSAAIANAATANVAPVTGMRRASPPRRSRSRVPVACRTDPAPRKSNPLKAAWLTTCNSAAASAIDAKARLPLAANNPAAPIPIRIRPTFSVVE